MARSDKRQLIAGNCLWLKTYGWTLMADGWRLMVRTADPTGGWLRK